MSSVEGSKQEIANKQQFALPMVAGSSRDAPRKTPPVLPSRLAIRISHQNDATINSFCGAVAGVASGIVTCPLDVIKTKLQAQGAFRPKNVQNSVPGETVHYRGMIGTARVIWTQDGLRGMYRGLGPMLFGYLPTWAVYMGVYGRSRDYYYTKLSNKWVSQMAASVTAGACSSLATNPIWVVKTRLMSQVGAAASKESRTPWHYKNTVDAFRQMYRAEGIRAFYSGLAPALLGLSHVAIQFPLYEYFKFNFTGLEMGDSSSQDSHWFGILAATFLSKICATTATYPHEVLRTRLQTQHRPHPGPSTRSQIGPLRSYGVAAGPQGASGTASSKAGSVLEQTQNMLPRYKGVVSTCRIILQEEGWRAFYYGMGTNMFRAVPAAMTTMFTFESLKRLMQGLQEEGRHLEQGQ